MMGEYKRFYRYIGQYQDYNYYEVEDSLDRNYGNRGYSHYEYQRALEDARSTQAPPPPPNDDNAKVERFQAQVKQELTAAIVRMGEGGWKSQYYTKPTPDGMPYDEVPAYRKWREARENWTRTGDTAYLKAVQDAVDFTCPPDASAYPVQIFTVNKGMSKAQKRALLTLLIACIAWTLFVLLVLV